MEETRFPCTGAGTSLKKGQVTWGNLTGYCGCKTCCGKKDKSLTRTGTEPRAGHTIAVDSRVIPLGTRIVIDGVTYLAEDTGKAIKGNQADIYFDTHEEAVRYGRRKKDVYLYHESNP